MKKRFYTGLILGLILIPVVSIEIFHELFQVLMTVFVIIASFELIRMYENEKPFDKIARIIIVVLTLANFLAVSGVFGMIGEDNPLNIFNVLGITTPFITLALFSLLVFLKDFNGEDIGKALTIVNYVGIGIASIVILRSLGVRFIVYLLIISFSTDVFALVFGVKFGKRKLAPHISPKKTWEGAIGGTIVATLLGSAFALLYGTFLPAESYLGGLWNPDGHQTLLHRFANFGEEFWPQFFVIVPITFVASIVAQIGDLVASKLKRTYNIKDFGTLLPGHGGILDRFDSVLFVAMFLTAVFLWIARIYPF